MAVSYTHLDVYKRQAPIQDFIRQNTLTTLIQNQFDALVSFAFNIGLENFKNCDVLRHLNQGEPICAAIAMNAWRRSHINGQQIVVDALVRRRALETAMFLDTIGPRPAAPSPIILPLLDYSASLLSPKPVAIRAVTVYYTHLDVYKRQCVRRAINL